MNFPILSSLILLPIVGAFFIFLTKSKNNLNLNSSKYVALFVSFANFFISLYLWYVFDSSTSNFQFIENRVWIKDFVNYKVGIDGISILFVNLSTLICALCVVSVNSNVQNKLKEFLILILIMESLMIGVFG